jgi:hypothetical protein
MIDNESYILTYDTENSLGYFFVESVVRAGERNYLGRITHELLCFYILQTFENHILFEIICFIILLEKGND